MTGSAEETTAATLSPWPSVAVAVMVKIIIRL
jgi:hypothetical protein